MTIRFAGRLAVRQARATLVVGLLLVLVSSSLLIVLGFIRELHQIDLAVAQMARMLDEPAGRALYDLDPEPAGSIVEGLLEYPMINKAELVDDFGVVLAAHERARTFSAFRHFAFLLGKRERYQFDLFWGAENKPVGKLVIHLDAGSILTSLASRAFRIMVAETITILLLASVLALFFYRLVTRPISKLTRDISLVDMEHPARAKVEVPAAHVGDELGILAKTTNELLERFGASLTRARQAEREARAREKEVVLYRDHLEELVKQRTDELERSHKELEQKRRLADIGALAAALAHRLRTPLAAMQMATFNIRAKAPALAGLESHLASIDKKIAESNQIISNLLMYSAQMKTPAYARINLAGIVDECLAITQGIFPHSRVEIRKSFSPAGECFIDADPFMIKELLCNVLSNAYEAVGDTGAVEVGLACGAETATISVKDSGPGMDKDVLDKIFDPFFTTKVSGMGIGLKICLQIARLHGGSIEVHTAAGLGTTISVILPVRRAGQTA